MVSIIIPVWGEYFKYLEECLNSIKNQTYKDYEIIIVDTETDLPTARNVGIKKAKGEWILTLDVDNKLYPEFLEKTVGKGDIVATYQQWFGDSDRTFCPIEPTLQDLYSGNKIDVNSLFRKEVWKTIGGYDENMKDGWEDYDFWFRCMKIGYKIVVIPELLLLYRSHGETMSVTAGRKGEELKTYILNKGMNVYIVMPHYIITEELKELATNAIKSFTDSDKNAIIISVDDGSPMDCTFLKELSHVYIKNPANIGFAHTCNAGFRWIFNTKKTIVILSVLTMTLRLMKELYRR